MFGAPALSPRPGGTSIAGATAAVLIEYQSNRSASMNALHGVPVGPRPRWAPSRARCGPSYSIYAVTAPLRTASGAPGALRRRGLASAPLVLARATAEEAPSSAQTAETDEEAWEKSGPDAAPSFGDLGVDRMFVVRAAAPAPRRLPPLLPALRAALPGCCGRRPACV